MKRVIRGASLLFFTVLFGLLVTGLFGQALADGEITIHPVDKNYPVEALLAKPQYRLQEDSPAPWYIRKEKERDRIFAAGNMGPKIQKWDRLEKVLFLQRLDWKSARGVASVYPQFTLSQLEKAEKVLRQVKDEK